MSYRAAKISFDGSHYIATPKENFPQGHKRRRAVIQPTPKEIEQKEQFEASYKESQKLPRKERKAVLADDFTCMVDGEIMGTVSPEVIEKMPKVN